MSLSFRAEWTGRSDASKPQSRGISASDLYSQKITRDREETEERGQARPARDTEGTGGLLTCCLSCHSPTPWSWDSPALRLRPVFKRRSGNERNLPRAGKHKLREAKGALKIKNNKGTGTWRIEVKHVAKWFRN